MQTSFVLDAGGYYAVARVGARKGVPLPRLPPLASLTDSSKRGGTLESVGDESAEVAPVHCAVHGAAHGSNGASARPITLALVLRADEDGPEEKMSEHRIRLETTITVAHRGRRRSARPPEGYVCKRCGSTEHYVDRCPGGRLAKT